MTSSDLPDTSTVEASVETTEADVWKAPVCLVKSVQASTLGRAYLTSGTFVDSRTLLVGEWNNERIVLFDDQYNYVKHFSVDGHPTEVTKGTTDDELYVVIRRKVISTIGCTH